MEQDRIEEIICSYLPAEEGLAAKLAEAMNYSVKAGGKRLRPRLIAETYEAFGGREEAVKPFMAAMEMIHTYSLCHDDLPCMDNDTLRRGKPTTWNVYGEDMGVLAGDALLTYAFETAVKAFRLTEFPERAAKALEILAYKAGISGMAGGQSLDVMKTGQPLTEDEMDFIYRLKTGALIEGSMMIGAVLAGADEASVRKAESCASAIGLAFQIRDDILDVIADEEQLGKPIGSDARNEKTTYVSLYGLEAAEKKVLELTAAAREMISSFPAPGPFFAAFVDQLAYRNK